jgi:predicted GNAT superfamily acetyltransferase
VAGEGELDFVFVANDQQGRGIGRALFEDMRETAAALGLARITHRLAPAVGAVLPRLRCGAVGTKPPVGRVTWAWPQLVLGLAHVAIARVPEPAGT